MVQIKLSVYICLMWKMVWRINGGVVVTAGGPTDGRNPANFQNRILFFLWTTELVNGFDQFYSWQISQSNIVRICLWGKSWQQPEGVKQFSVTEGWCGFSLFLTDNQYKLKDWRHWYSGTHTHSLSLLCAHHTFLFIHRTHQTPSNWHIGTDNCPNTQ